MLARRIVKIGCNPLLYFFLKRQKSDAEIRCGSSRSTPLNGMTPFFQGAVRFDRTRPLPLSNTSSARFFYAALAWLHVVLARYFSGSGSGSTRFELGTQ
jgi:hypothetical protein